MATEQISLPRKTKPPQFLTKYFYFSMSLLIAAVVVYGFSHTIDEDLLHASPAPPWILWVHGIAFSGWVAFYIFQSALVRTHNVKLHRTMGWFGAGLATFMTVLGTSTAIVMDRFNYLHFHSHKTFFAIQLLDMVSFTTIFWLAIYWRKKPEFHRRLMLIATCVLLSAAFARFPQIAGPKWAYCGVDGLILLGIARDWIVNRRIHVVYLYALPPLIVFQTFMVNLWLRHPDWWVRTTNAIIR